MVRGAGEGGERSAQVRSGAFKRGAQPTRWSCPYQYFGRIEGTPRGMQDGSPGGNRSGFILSSRSAQHMKHRITRAWQFALAVSPLAAIALVEAAMRRWF